MKLRHKLKIAIITLVIAAVFMPLLQASAATVISSGGGSVTVTTQPGNTSTSSTVSTPGNGTDPSNNGGGFSLVNIDFGGLIKGVTDFFSSGLILLLNQGIQTAIYGLYKDANALCTFGIQMLKDNSHDMAYSGIVKTLNTGFMGAASSLFVLFAIISLSRKVAAFEFTSVIGYARYFAQLGVGSTVFAINYQICTAILGMNTSLINLVLGSVKSITFTPPTYQLSTTAAVTDFFSLMTIMQFIPMVFIICFIVVCVCLMLRQVELSILISTAPIFFAGLGGEETTDITVSFIKSFVAVALSNTFIAVCFVLLFSTSTTTAVQIVSDSSGISATTDSIRLVVSTIALAVFAVKAPKSIQQILGSTSYGFGGIAGAAQMAFSAARAIL